MKVLFLSENMSDINNEILKNIELANYELKSAKILLDAGQYRDSITHSYYAMYSAGKALLFTKNYVVKTHEGLIHVLGREFVRDNDFDENIFKYLTIARSVRKDSSYDSFAVFSKNDAEKYFSKAKIFIDEVMRFL